MAYNNDNENNGGGYKKRSISFPLGDRFYNHRDSTDTGCGPMQMEIWDNRLNFSFAKFDNSKKGADSVTNGRYTVTADVAMLILSVVEQIITQRYDIWIKSKGKPVYPAFEVPIQDVFMDKEREIHNVGYFFFKTVEVIEDGNKVNRIQFGHTNDKDTFKVVLASALTPIVVSKFPDSITRVDPHDVPFYRFIMQMKQYVKYGAIFYSGLNRLAGVLGYGQDNRSIEDQQDQGDGQRRIPPRGSGGSGYKASSSDHAVF